MCRKMIVVAACLMLSASAAQADKVVLKNGDQLTGTIVKLTDGKLVLKSAAVGEVTVSLDDVNTFSSDEQLKVHLKDGTILNQKIAAGEAGQFAIADDQALQAQSFAVADITAINPPRPKWTGNLSGALTSTHGNTRANSLTASLALLKRTEKDRTQISADYAKSRQAPPAGGPKVTTEDWWRAKGKYDYFFSDKFYAFVDGRYEKDGIALLDRRVLIGGGGGYQWIETPTTNFSTEFGLASLYEKFDNLLFSNSELSAQLGYNFDRQLTKAVKFLHDTTYYPSLDKFSDYYLTSTAELRAKLTDQMFANFKVIFNYDATPAPGQGNTDVKYILGVGINF